MKCVPWPYFDITKSTHKRSKEMVKEYQNIILKLSAVGLGIYVSIGDKVDKDNTMSVNNLPLFVVLILTYFCSTYLSV